MNLGSILLIIAVVLFVLDALSIVLGNVSLVSLGLAAFAGSSLVGSGGFNLSAEPLEREGKGSGIGRLDVDRQAVPAEPRSDVGDVAVQQVVRIGVGGELDRLRKVDDHQAAYATRSGCRRTGPRAPFPPR